VFSYEAVRDWKAKLAPALADELRQRLHDKGGDRDRRWHMDETYLKVGGRWAYLYRAIDRGGNLIDTMLSEHHYMVAARAFFHSTKVVMGVTPDQVTSDRQGSYPHAVRSALDRPMSIATALIKTTDWNTTIGA
jgi:transposase-like protein